MLGGRGGAGVRVNKCLGLGTLAMPAECAIAGVGFAPCGCYTRPTPRMGGDWFPVFGQGSETVRGFLVFLSPPLKNGDLSVPISGNFRLGVVSAGVWSGWKVLAGPKGWCLRSDWVIFGSPNVKGSKRVIVLGI